jgi:hypothetical protein
VTPDEISEFAECLWDACAEAERRGLTVRPTRGEVGQCKTECCPLGALLGDDYPLPWDAYAKLESSGVSQADLCDFLAGFDGHRRSRIGLVALGRRFREQALRHGGFR